MNDIAVGIDIGTSYTKAAARSADGTVLAVCRRPSPQVRVGSSIDMRSATAWWTCVKDVLRDLLLTHGHRRMRVISICVSAIAPTMTVFDAMHPDSAYSILYSSLGELEAGGSLSQCDPDLTRRRLEVLKRVAFKERFASPCITDLVGYVNWRFTGALTINGISLAEMGMTRGAKDSEMFGVAKISPRLVAVRDPIGHTTAESAGELGIEPGIPVCGGCPDTMGSVVGAGVVRKSEMMLYLGTFGSILHLEQDVDALLRATAFPNPPFRWSLSVPGLGPEIESLSEQWFGSVAASDRLHSLDQAARQAPGGAGGTIFLIPRWKNGMTSVGRYEFIPDRNGEIGDIQRQARAALEGIA